MSWLVLEAGSWQVAGGRRLEVGTVATGSTVGRRVADEWAEVGFSSSFADVPVILTQVQTENDPHWVSTRQRNTSTTGFKVALEEDEAQDTPHAEEVIGWLAIEPGLGTWDGHAFEAGHTGDSIHSLPTLVALQQGFSEAPRFLGSLATRDTEDNAHLRYRALTAGGLLLRVEEDRTWDVEMLHGTEIVDYLAIEGDGVLTAEAAESETRYYYLNNLRVAMREGEVVFFIVGDHLGTTSLVLDADEAWHSESRHYPYGSERWTTGAVPTDYRFTGQRFDSYTKLTMMGARWYDSSLGGWISPDSIVPGPTNPKILNRYA